MNPVEDQWYRATTPSGNVSVYGTQGTYATYRADEPAAPLACSVQSQLCMPGTLGCGPLAGIYDALAGAFRLFGHSRDEALAMVKEFDAGGLNVTKYPELSRMAWSSTIFGWAQGPFNIINTVNGQALPSRDTVTGGMQVGNLSGQWQKDMIHIWQASLAVLQAQFLDTARGPSDPALNDGSIRPADQTQRNLCSNQASFLLALAILPTDSVTEIPKYRVCIIQLLRPTLHLCQWRRYHRTIVDH